MKSKGLYSNSNSEPEELMKTRETLEESEQRYRDLLESSSMGLMELDMKKWQISYVNQRLIDIIGYSREELNKNNLMAKVIHPDDIYEIINSFEDGDLECRITSKDGQLKWLAGTKIGQYNEKTELISLRIWLYDITEKKLKEQKLSESEEKYRFLFENSPFPIFLINMKGKVLDCNPSFEEVTGYRREEILGINYANLKLIHPKYLPILLNRFKLIKKVKKHPILEIELYKKDGSIIWVRFQSSLVEIGNKAFIQVIGDDITPQKEAEKKLRESEIKYRSIIEASPNLMLLFDDKGTVIDCNNSVLQYFELPRKNIIGFKIYELLSNFSEDSTISILNLISNNLRNNKSDPIEFSYINSKNKTQWYQLYYSTVKIGENSFFHLELQDFTKLKEAENIIKEENRRLMDLDKLRKKFLDTAAHELKTPLTSVYGAIQLIYELNIDILNPESLKFIEIAKNGSERLKDLILNLLDISRLEFNNFRIHKKNHDLVNIIKNCISDINYLFYKRGQLIILDLPENLYVEVDKSGIERVIINLLSNATKYTPPKGKIEVKLGENKNYIELSIKDTGVGLTKKEINKIFNKFSKIERSKDVEIDLIKEGTGLGLNISKEIVEMHGGQIWVSSEGRNKGSTFIVRLPVNKK